ncbi:MAG: nitrogenase-stabilizing/protective protein NifW [Gammaproteobacteria bacterium]|jgi:nitrogenase-stabilizing/protective protein
MQDSDDLTLDEALEELSSAEDFLDFFEVPYEHSVVHVNRLHILQRFNEYISQSVEMIPEGDEAKKEVYRRLLARAYQDFVESDALTEKVFKVFHMNEAQETFVSIDLLQK